MSDIIAAKCGRHFNSIEAIKQCSRYPCGECTAETETPTMKRDKPFPVCPANQHHTIRKLGDAWCCDARYCQYYHVLKRTCKYCHTMEATIFDGTSPIPEFCSTHHKELYYEELNQNKETVKDTNVDSHVTLNEDLKRNETASNPEYIQSVKSFAEPPKQLEPLSQNIEPTPNNSVQTTIEPNSNPFNMDINNATKSKSDSGYLSPLLFIFGALGTVGGTVYGIINYFFTGTPKHAFSYFVPAIVSFCLFITSFIISPSKNNTK